MDSVLEVCEEAGWAGVGEGLPPWKALELGYSYEMLDLKEVLSVPSLSLSLSFPMKSKALGY